MMTFDSTAGDQYNYDLNGNTLFDDVNGNYDFKYDYRNLITELYHKDPASVSRPNTYATRYYYDESGNRVRKLIYFTSQANPPPVIDWNNPGNGWQLSNNEFYIKGVDGKDLAIYKGNVLDEWFVWGNDLVGKIRGDKQYYYYKDHLGSVRVVVDNKSAIVAGYDYDAWGYPLENRVYNGDSIKYKFTSKELDKESFYDYFGARYYDSRIGRWGQVDPKIENTYTFGSYVYCVDNPLRVVDPFGLDWFYIERTKKWEYIEDASSMVIINYDEESGITTNSIVQGEKEFLEFNGSALTWYYPKGLIRMWNARSGNLDEQGKTQPELQNERKIGPIPEGWWNINPTTAYYYPYNREKFWHTPSEETLRSWGMGWTPLSPTRGNITERGNFFIHGGLIPGSAGCIDLMGGIDDFLINFINNEKSLDVHVRY